MIKSINIFQISLNLINNLDEMKMKISNRITIRLIKYLQIRKENNQDYHFIGALELNQYIIGIKHDYIRAIKLLD